MGGGEAEGGKVDAGGKAQEAVVGTGKVVGGVVVGGFPDNHRSPGGPRSHGSGIGIMPCVGDVGAFGVARVNRCSKPWTRCSDGEMDKLSCPCGFGHNLSAAHRGSHRDGIRGGLPWGLA